MVAAAQETEWRSKLELELSEMRDQYRIHHVVWHRLVTQLLPPEALSWLPA